MLSERSLIQKTTCYMKFTWNLQKRQFYRDRKQISGCLDQAAVHGVAKSQTRLSDLTFTFHFHALEKEMATHCSVLAWRIPGTGKPGGLPFTGSHRVGHDWSDLAAAAAELEMGSKTDWKQKAVWGDENVLQLGCGDNCTAL